MNTLLATSLRNLWESGPAGTVDLQSPEGVWIALLNFLSNSFYWLLLLAGFAGTIAIIVGGYYLLTSGGNPQRAGQGKNYILWAIVGIVIVALARLIVRTVITIIQPPSTVPLPSF
ncbi:hypothetical protein J7L13_03585 [bacterium]|nr:hypothetical protein [bacterium]